MFAYTLWLNLSLATRNKIAKEFNIAKTSSIEVVDNYVKSDGFRVHDVENALTVQSLQSFLGTEESDMAVLWVEMVKKIESVVDVIPQPKMPEPIKPEEMPKKIQVITVPEVKPKRGRPRKK